MSDFSADALVAAIEGEYGPEAQQEALDTAEQLGLIEMWENNEAAAGEEQFLQAAGEELGRVESLIGRELTKAEETAMLNSVSTQDFEEGAVPNLVERFGAELQSRHLDDDGGRLGLLAERADEQFDFSEGFARPRQEPPEPPAFNPQPEPQGPQGAGGEEGEE